MIQQNITRHLQIGVVMIAIIRRVMILTEGGHIQRTGTEVEEVEGQGRTTRTTTMDIEAQDAVVIELAPCFANAKSFK